MRLKKRSGLGHRGIILCHTEELDSIGKRTSFKNKYMVMSSLEMNFLEYITEDGCQGAKIRSRKQVIGCCTVQERDDASLIQGNNSRTGNGKRYKNI